MAAAKRPKMPKGESPKKLTGYATYLKDRRPNISKSEAAAQAGKVRQTGVTTDEFKGYKSKPAAKSSAKKINRGAVKGAKVGAAGLYAKNASVEETFKFLGKAAKANVSMPGRAVKDVKKTVSKAAKGFAKGYKGK